MKIVIGVEKRRAVKPDPAVGQVGLEAYLVGVDRLLFKNRQHDDRRHHVLSPESQIGSARFKAAGIGCVSHRSVTQINLYSETPGDFLALDLEDLSAFPAIKVGDRTVHLILGVPQAGDHPHTVSERPRALTVKREGLPLWFGI